MKYIYQDNLQHIISLNSLHTDLNACLVPQDNKQEVLLSLKCRRSCKSTMEDKILRTINKICLNFSPFPPLP